MDISSAQKLAWENKLGRGFNTADVALEFGLLTAEVGEAFTAWRKGLPDLGEELADVFLYLNQRYQRLRLPPLCAAGRIRKPSVHTTRTMIAIHHGGWSAKPML